MAGHPDLPLVEESQHMFAELRRSPGAVMHNGTTPFAGASQSLIRVSNGDLAALARRSRAFVLALLCAASFSLAPQPAYAGKDYPIRLTKMSDREGKALFKATWGRGGRLGTFYDVDADGKLEFIALERNKGQLTLELMQIDRHGPTFATDAGEGVAAGLVAVNLDDDEPLEFIVAHGDRIGAVQLALVVFANTLLGTFANVPVFDAGGMQYAIAPVLVPNGNIDLYNLLAYDDDGSQLWHRDLRAGKAAGEAWKETRFQWTVQHGDGSGATILITDDERHEMLGLSGDDGSIVWTQSLEGKTRASQRNFSALIGDEGLLPVLFSPGEILIINPETGIPVYDGPLDRSVWEMPSWRIFGSGADRGYLVFGENRSELRMVSLATGNTLWSTRMSDKVLEIVPLRSGDRFILVSKTGIRLMDAGGSELAEYPAPATIKAKYPPVYRDLDGDGVMELVFVSGKKFMAWRPSSNELLWETSLFGLVGGANPVELYSTFLDIDGDGWLDVPGKKGGGTGQWLSGRTGELLTEVGNGSTTPVVGDWNDNGRPEIFWFKTWYEVPPPD